MLGRVSRVVLHTTIHSLHDGLVTGYMPPSPDPLPPPVPGLKRLRWGCTMDGMTDGDPSEIARDERQARSFGGCLPPSGPHPPSPRKGFNHIIVVSQHQWKPHVSSSGSRARDQPPAAHTPSLRRRKEPEWESCAATVTSFILRSGWRRPRPGSLRMRRKGRRYCPSLSKSQRRQGKYPTRALTYLSHVAPHRCSQG